jgi:hypothetical protein
LDFLIKRRRRAGIALSGTTRGRASEEEEEEEDQKVVEEVLSRLRLITAFDLDAVKSGLEEELEGIDGTLDGHSGEGGWDNNRSISGALQRGKKVIVIDSIATILSPCLSTGDSHGTSFLSVLSVCLASGSNRLRVRSLFVDWNMCRL